MDTDTIQEEIIESFAELDDYMDRFQLLVDMGNDLPALDERLKKPEYKIEGCQSSVWVYASFDEGTRKIHYEAESDTVIVKGLVFLLLKVLNDRTPEEVLSTDLYFIEKIGLREHLSPNRSNGLTAIIKQMRDYALAFKTVSAS